jgi:hypothetical protein
MFNNGIGTMKLAVFAFTCLMTITSSATAQSGAGPKAFESKECGFRATPPPDWKIKSVESKKCAFIITAPNNPDQNLEVSVRKSSPDEGERELGFSIDNGKWMLHGDDVTAAEVVDSSSWTGLQGTVSIRNSKEKSKSTLQQTRALLFDRKSRIAEVTGWNSEQQTMAFVDGFEFLPESAP